MSSSINPLSWRARTLSLLLIAGTCLIGTAGWERLQFSEQQDRVAGRAVHRSDERADALSRLSASIVPTDLETQPPPSPCAELLNVKRAIDARLEGLQKPQYGGAPIVNRRYVLDIGRLAAAASVPPLATSCVQLAKDVDVEVKRSWNLFLVADQWRENAYNQSDKRWNGRFWLPRNKDIETPNTWQAMAGCVSVRGEAASGVCDGKPAQRMFDLLADPALVTALEYRALEIAHTASGRNAVFHGKETPVGKSLDLRFARYEQQRAHDLVHCFTGTAPCGSLLPSHLAADWHYQDGAIRAGAAAVVLVKVSSGEVVAASGAMSNCTRRNLERERMMVYDERSGKERVPLFRPASSELCAQVPDRAGKAGYLTVLPWFWSVGPGSTKKTEAILAGIEAGIIPESMDAIYRKMLAQSHDPGAPTQLVPQRIALQAAPEYMKLQRYLGYEGLGAAVDAITGQENPADGPGWLVRPRSGLRVEDYAITYPLIQRIYAEKMAGRTAESLFGRAVVDEYLKAYRLGITAVGSGDVRGTVWGLADWSRRLALRADGDATMPATHLALVEGDPPPEVSLDFAKPESVRRLIGMLDAATVRALGGTASGSCRVAFGKCPASGHPAILFAKTGTSEAGEGGEASPWVKEGGAGTAPAKLFMMVFRAADGERYAAAGMTLRIRQTPKSPLPELHSNSAAELVMLLARPLIESPEVGSPRATVAAGKEERLPPAK